MAEQFPKRSEAFLIDRRRLLTTAAGVTAASIAPVTLGQAAVVNAAEPIVPRSAAPVRNFSATTTARIVEIERRNWFRQESGLPLLSVAREFRHIKTFEAARAFAKFTARFQSRVQDKALTRIRRRLGDPSWKPRGFFGGMAIQNEVSGRLRRVYARLG